MLYSSSTFKKQALESLSGRWKIPVIAVIISYAMFIAVYLTFMLFTTISLKRVENTETAQLFTLGLIFLLELFFIFILSGIIISYLRLTIFLEKNTQSPKFFDWAEGFSMSFKFFAAYLWYILWVCLWACLFYIPGIIKTYSYSQMFFIIAENPKIKINQAMQLSRRLTYGYKGDLFCLQLSFIGWQILNSLTFGILFFWTGPYMAMTYEKSYQYLKTMALETGVVKPEDFN